MTFGDNPDINCMRELQGCPISSKGACQSLQVEGCTSAPDKVKLRLLAAAADGDGKHKVLRKVLEPQGSEAGGGNANGRIHGVAASRVHTAPAAHAHACVQDWVLSLFFVFDGGGWVKTAVQIPKTGHHKPQKRMRAQQHMCAPAHMLITP